MCGQLKRLFPVLNQWAERHLFARAAAVLILSTLPFLAVINDPLQSDVYLYSTVASDIRAGKLPYKDTELAYPPYSILIFLLPAVFGDENYATCFTILAVIADLAIKCLLLSIGLREANGMRSLLPLTFYCLALPFIRYFFLQRYDVFPALISLAALWFFCSQKYALSGLMISLGVGLKLYPILFAPPLFILACRQRHARTFLLGLIGGISPLILLSLWLPWWNFLALHGERGLQAESLYGSVIWLAHHFGLTHAEWVGGRGCLEVHGSLANLVLPWSRASLILVVGSSILIVHRFTVRSPELRLPQLARLLLVPLLAFVAFNQVFSPQFMVWLLPLAATGSLCRKFWMTAIIPLATMLTPIFYPSPEYFYGLNFFETQVLVARNFMVIGLWIFLSIEVSQSRNV